MEHTELQELRDIAKAQADLALEYCKHRTLAGEAKTALDIILAANLPAIREEKSNVGIEMAYLMLLEYAPESKELFRTWQNNEAKYKGLERLMDARASRIMMEQSIMKWRQQGERYGNE